MLRQPSTVKSPRCIEQPISHTALRSARSIIASPKSAFYELNHMELPLVLALRLGVHPYDDRLSICGRRCRVCHVYHRADLVRDRTRQECVYHVDRARTHQWNILCVNASSLLSLTWTHTFSDDANISATNLGWTYTFGKE